MATKLYIKILPAKTRLFRIIEVTPMTVTIDQNGIRTTVFGNCDTPALNANKTPTEENRTETDNMDTGREETHIRDMLLEKENFASAR